MVKWYKIQFVIVSVLNILILLSVMVGTVLSKKEYIYITETVTISISILVLSGILWILSDIYYNSEN